VRSRLDSLRWVLGFAKAEEKRSSLGARHGGVGSIKAFKGRQLEAVVWIEGREGGSPQHEAEDN
jgi:hypothetical protein